MCDFLCRVPFSLSFLSPLTLTGGEGHSGMDKARRIEKPIESNKGEVLDMTRSEAITRHDRNKVEGGTR